MASNYYAELAEVQEAFNAIGPGSGSDNVRIECPICPDRTGKYDHRRSLSINTHSGFFSCFKCAMKGRLEGYGDDDEDWDYGGSDVPERTALDLPEDFHALGAEDDGSITYGQYLHYLGTRGLTWDIIQGAGLGIGGKRIVCPVKDVGGVLRGHVSRRIDAVKPERLPGVKYLYPKGFKRSQVLFNEAALQRQDNTPVAVVEGMFDALRHWPTAVACLGKPAREHVATLAASSRTVVVCLDADAWEEGRALSNRLQLLGVRTNWIGLPYGLDPGDIPTPLFKHFLAQAAGMHQGLLIQQDM